jgi:hypothetical protein
LCQVAQRHADEYCTRQLGYGTSNMRFVEGHIEYLDAAGIGDESVRATSIPTPTLPGQGLGSGPGPG